MKKTLLLLVLTNLFLSLTTVHAQTAAPPYNITVSDVSYDRFTIHWEDTSGTTIHLSYSTDPTRYTITYQGYSDSLTISDLTPNTLYYIRIKNNDSDWVYLSHQTGDISRTCDSSIEVTIQEKKYYDSPSTSYNAFGSEQWFHYTATQDGQVTIGKRDTTGALNIYDACDGNLIAEGNVSGPWLITALDLQTGETIKIQWIQNNAEDESTTWYIEQGKMYHNLNYSLIPTKVVKGSAIRLEATSNSDAPIEYSLQDSTVATLEGDSLTFDKIGVVELRIVSPDTDYFNMSMAGFGITVVANDCATADPITAGTHETHGSEQWYSFTANMEGTIALYPMEHTDENTKVEVYQECDGELIASKVYLHDDAKQDYLNLEVTYGNAYLIKWIKNNTTSQTQWALEWLFADGKNITKLAINEVEEVLVNSDPFELSAATNSNGNINWFIEEGEDLISLDSNIVTLAPNAIGQVKIKAVQHETAEYWSAIDSMTFSIIKRQDSISSNIGIEEAQANTSMVLPSLKTDAGLAIFYEVTEGNATLEDSILKIQQIGDITLRLYSEGNEAYEATESTNTIIVNSVFTSTEQFPKQKVSIYPNPITDKVIIQVPLKTTSTLSLAISSMTGQILFEKQFGKWSGGFKYALPFNEYKQGIYLLIISTDEESVVKKIIKE
ncbi:T9SS type A sorting domain-containing protein [Algivirga pacifica]|uniref:Fibronectin type-III domain-containing protein n=1 Tax=Algivirga pacifica TaxID=1162670 RepID=A0ABP9CYY6_9BACT